MTQRDRNDAILVKIITYEDDEETMVSSYYTTALDQTLKMFITARDYNLPCYFNDFSECIDKKYSSMELLIEDVRLILGSKEDMPVIEVVI